MLALSVCTVRSVCVYLLSGSSAPLSTKLALAQRHYLLVLSETNKQTHKHTHTHTHTHTHMKDANKLVKLLRDAEGTSFGNEVYQVEFPPDCDKQSFAANPFRNHEYLFTLTGVYLCAWCSCWACVAAVKWCDEACIVCVRVQRGRSVLRVLVFWLHSE
jgi:hypothetical protein